VFVERVTIRNFKGIRDLDVELVEDTDRATLEQRLAELGDDILEHSDTLKSLRDSLDSLDRYVDSLGSTHVDLVPRTLEELARAVGVSFNAVGQRPGIQCGDREDDDRCRAGHLHRRVRVPG